MKNQIEFCCMDTEEPFIIDPADIFVCSKHLNGCMIRTAWGEYITVSESYETVKRRLANFYKPLENISGWPYGE